MTLPVVPGKLVFYSQRIDGRPFVNCGPYSLCTVLRWMGYDVPADYGMTIRRASGIPVEPHRGMSWAALIRAARKVLPDVALTKGTISMADMLTKLRRKGHRGRHAAVFVVGVPNTDKLPRHYQRLVGQNYDGGHYIVVAGVRYTNDFGSRIPPTVKILDPMGRTTPPKNAPADWQPYSGDWIAVSDLEPALQRGKDGNIKSIYGFRNTAA